MSVVLGLVGLVLGGVIVGVFDYLRFARQLKIESEKQTLQQTQLQDKTRSLKTMLDIMLRSNASSQQGIVDVIGNLFDNTTKLADNSAGSLTTIFGSIENSKARVVELTENMASLQQRASSGADVAEQLNQSLSEFRETSARLNSIQTQMATIQDKANAIKSVGQDAEMLALNAAIEAARAGETGRGFAVVADSMKDLAKSSQAMTDDIQSVLDTSHQDITQITESITERSESLLVNTDALVETYQDVNSTIDEVGKQAEELDGEFESVMAVVEGETASSRTAMEDLVRELTIAANLTSGLEIIDLAPKKAQEQLSSFDYLIDVRREAEYNDELGHIPGTKLITLQTDFPAEVKKLPKDKRYLFICRSGGRSTKAAQQALLNNIRDVYNLDGGMLAWRKAGL